MIGKNDNEAHWHLIGDEIQPGSDYGWETMMKEENFKNSTRLQLES